MIKLKDIAFSYGEEFILKDLNLNLALGKIHGILGPNGAGKTTLFKLITNQLSLVEGSISVDDKALKREDISYLETSNYFYPYIKGKEYLDLLNQNASDIEQWNALFNLPLEELVDTYSTGLKKKLAFLGILLQERKLIILDEPFNGVDIESNEKLFQIIKSLSSHGKTILISSHILSSLTNMCDDISTLENKNISKTYFPDEFPVLKAKMKASALDSIGSQMDVLLGKK